ncbi:N-lysine methyltransferase SMYD2-B [Labeo rohita]|uniref:[histone H3]-lysine(4) N-trimethyltransferase n=1 Tax=Labeo rohita TaxID=84645 RepID=A0A498MGV4_LABRO|nr:N-lysine methyltransferase SMYD2-B [Labeo rohita]
MFFELVIMPSAREDSLIMYDITGAVQNGNNDFKMDADTTDEFSCNEKQKKKTKRIWKRECLGRHEQPRLSILQKESEMTDENGFGDLMWMTAEEFEFLLRMVGPLITKQHTKMRRAISPRDRLSVTLRFLATGKTFSSLSAQYKIGASTISQIVMETCGALYQLMKKDFLKFIYATVGTQEKVSDAGLFAYSDLCKEMDQGQLNFPPPEPLPNSDIMMPYMFVGDEACPLRPDLVKPYPNKQMDHSQQKKNWPMHKLECHAMCAFGENWCPSETVRLVARIIARLRHQRERSPSEKLLSLRDMESHMEDMDNEKRELNEAHIAGLHHFYSKHLDFPDHQALLTLFSQVHCNGFTVEDEELSNLGLAIFPDIALLNHSCCPNVIVTYRGINAEVRAVQEISQGQEIYTSYIDLLYPTEDRIERLRDVYYFSCDCKECSTKSMDKQKLKVRKLSDEISQKEIRDMAMGICIFNEDYDGGVRYGEKVMKPYTVLYPAYSLNIASMYLKMGRLYMALDKKSTGINAFQKALAIMEVVYGKDHAYVTELKQEIRGE